MLLAFPAVWFASFSPAVSCLLRSGNSAGIAISLSVIAAWCFLRESYARVGVLCLAISLLIKPHNAGFVWFYFFLEGGVLRRRALQSLLITVILGLPSVLWVSQISPHWIQEMQTNISKFSAHGDLNDTGVSTLNVTSHGAAIVSLQMVVGVFSDDLTVQNTVAYLVCAPLLLIWGIVSFRAPSVLGKRVARACYHLSSLDAAALSSATRYKNVALDGSRICDALERGRELEVGGSGGEHSGDGFHWRSSTAVPGKLSPIHWLRRRMDCSGRS